MSRYSRSKDRQDAAKEASRYGNYWALRYLMAQELADEYRSVIVEACENGLLPFLEGNATVEEILADEERTSCAQTS